MMATIKKKWLSGLVALLVLLSLAFSVYIFSGDLGQFANLNIRLNYSALAWAVAIVAVNHVLQSLIWCLLIRQFSAGQSAYVNILRYSLASLTKNIPGAFYWSTASRVLLYKEEGDETVAAVATGAELIIQIFSGLILALALSVWPYGLLLLLIFAALPLLLAKQINQVRIPLPARIAKRWPKVKLALDSLFSLPGKTIAVSLVVYFVIWYLGGVFTQAVGSALGIAILQPYSLYRAWTISSLAGIVGSIIFGGLGVLREITLTGLLSSTIPLAAATALAILTRITLIAGSWLSGLAAALICFIIQKGERA